MPIPFHRFGNPVVQDPAGLAFAAFVYSLFGPGAARMAGMGGHGGRGSGAVGASGGLGRLRWPATPGVQQAPTIGRPVGGRPG